jgi:hypothetical protein
LRASLASVERRRGRPRVEGMIGTKTPTGSPPLGAPATAAAAAQVN